MKEGDLVAGRYRLLRPIGAGAMGTVWAARHELLGRELALKMASVGDRDARARRGAHDLFLREVRIVGKLRHPNVVEIADAGDAGGDGLYLAMELLEGESLAQRIAAGPMGPVEALSVAAATCRGLAAAHAAGVVHRDLKPENIFLARGQAGSMVPKLLDFGVSSARGVATLHREKLFGTPAYMSPEQALGEGDIDHRTDVWALGVVLYEMLTGRLPFVAASYPALLPLIIEGSYPALPACIPGGVHTVVAGCLAKDRRYRYATADALLEAIERALAALLAADPVPASLETVPTFGRTLPAAAEPHHTTSARTVRFGLAVAIFSVPVAVGLATVASGTRSPQASTSGASAPPGSRDELPLSSPPTPPDRSNLPAWQVVPTASASVQEHGSASAVPARSATAPYPAASAGVGRSSARPFSDVAVGHDARHTPPTGRGPGDPAPRAPVTNVNNAGF